MHEEQEVTQTTPETDSAAEFEELIQGRCKQPFQQRVQKILDGRLRSLRQETRRCAVRRRSSAALKTAAWSALPVRRRTSAGYTAASTGSGRCAIRPLAA